MPRTRIRSSSLLAVIVAAVTILGCGFPHSQAVDEDDRTVLDAGEAALDRLTVPSTWRAVASENGRNIDGNLYWKREYEVFLSTRDALRDYSAAAGEAGFRDTHSCVPADVCSSFDTDRYHLMVDVTDGACANLPPGCVNVSVWMSRR